MLDRNTTATLAQLMKAHNDLHALREVEKVLSLFTPMCDDTDIILDAVHTQMNPLLDAINKVNANKIEDAATRAKFSNVAKDISAPREAHKNTMQELLAKDAHRQTMQEINRKGSPSLFALKHVAPVSDEQNQVAAPQLARRNSK